MEGKSPDNVQKLKKMRTLLMDEMNETKRQQEQQEAEMKRKMEIHEKLEEKYVELKQKYKVLLREHEQLQEDSK